VHLVLKDHKEHRVFLAYKEPQVLKVPRVYRVFLVYKVLLDPQAL
jgi:hypothetical protein